MDAAELSPGAVVAGHRILRRIGKGGMGAVYAAVEPTLGRPVAIKVLSGELAQQPRYVERFRREAEAAAALAHPNIVSVTGLLHGAGAPLVIVMEMLEGESLYKAVKRGPLAPARASRIATALASALSAAHAHGIVHRDLKPGNVFLVPQADGTERVKLLDFGIAKLRESDGYKRLTQTGVLVGTPRYASPEQVMGARDIDARSDVFALGVLLYAMLSGRPPFGGRGAELLVAIQHHAPAPLARLVPGLDPGLIGIVERAMQKDRAARFQSAEAMHAALLAGATESVPQAAPMMVSLPATPPTEVPRSTQRAHQPRPQTPYPQAPATRVSQSATTPGLRPRRSSRLPLLVALAALGLATLTASIAVGALLFGHSGSTPNAEFLGEPSSADWRPTRPAMRLGYHCMEYERAACGCWDRQGSALCRHAVANNRGHASLGESNFDTARVNCDATTRTHTPCPMHYELEDVTPVAEEIGGACAELERVACDCNDAIGREECAFVALLLGPDVDAVEDPAFARQLCAAHLEAAHAACDR